MPSARLHSPLLAALALGLLALALPAGTARAAPVTFLVTMSGAQVVPPLQNGYSGFAQLSFDPDSRALQYTVVVIGAPPSAVAGAELRQGALGANGGLVLQLVSGSFVQSSGRAVLTQDQATLLLTGALYVEVRGPSGPLIRGHVIGPATLGTFPTVFLPPIVLPTETPAPPPPGPAPRQAVTGVILPPSTGNAGLR
jgi:hypothetical protein